MRLSDMLLPPRRTNNHGVVAPLQALGINKMLIVCILCLAIILPTSL